MVKITKKNNSEIEIESEITAEEFGRFFKLALKNFKDNFEMPGFRKGSVPEAIVQEKIGEDKILNAASELALKDLWPKLIKEEKLEPIGHPEILITKLARGNELAFKINVAILPEIIMPDYKAIAREMNLADKPDIEASAEEVEKTYEAVKKEHPKFLENAGDEIKAKEAIKQNLLYEKNRRAKDKKRMDFLDVISKKTDIAIPEVLIEREIERMLWELQNSLKEMGLNWKDYLEHIKKTEDELKKAWREDALRRVRFGLILRQIALAEKFTPSEEALETEATRMLLSLPEDERKKASKANLKEHLVDRLQNEMVFEMLEKEK
ncbi:MAG: trigger factor [bacterium]|nr:trigger factor [bacterium]